MPQAVRRHRVWKGARSCCVTSRLRKRHCLAGKQPLLPIALYGRHELRDTVQTVNTKSAIWPIH